MCFTIALGRLYYLHVHEQSKLEQIAENNRKQFSVLAAKRGNIVDSSGNLLATTKSSITIGVDPHSADSTDIAKIKKLSKYLNVPVQVIIAKFDKKFISGSHSKELKKCRWQKLASSIDEDVYKQIKALKIKGVYGNRKFERTYPGGSLASHLIGFINKEGNSVMGTERFMDYYLRGQDGWRETERDGRKREIAQFRTREVQAKDGLNIRLTIDQVIQSAIEEELKVIAEKYTPKGATIIVSEPKTGYILGMGNYPDFDPNSFWKSPIDSHRNRALSDIFEPGSTFKIVPTSAALNEKIVKVNDRFNCSLEKVKYKGRSVKLPSDHHKYKMLSVKDIVIKSSNRGAALMGMMVGENKMYEYARAFGFGTRTNLGLSGEVSGILHPVKKWDGLTITRLPMGHAIGVTAMQIHNAMAVIANHGVLMKPTVFKQVFDDSNRPIIAFSPKVKHRVVSTITADAMVDMLKEVTKEGGTASMAGIKGFEVAGKTGTTQKIINGRYSKNHHVASFIGFLPANDPRIVITVIVDDANSRGIAYGGSIAGPSFKNIAKQVIRHMGILPSPSRVQSIAANQTSITPPGL